MKKALTIAGSDSSGGAGIQADLKTFSSLGIYGSTIITALTAQNTTTISDIFTVDPKFFKNQLITTIEDIKYNAIKIGVLYDNSIIEIVSNLLNKVNIPIIVDPVLISGTGVQLLKDDALESFKKKIIPLSYVLTPNLAEAELLTQSKIVNRDGIIIAAKKLLNLGAKNVIIKGSHRLDNSNKVVDTLVIGKTSKIFRISHKKLKLGETHGTGCNFSSSLTAFIAKGFSLRISFILSNKYVYSALKKSVKVGHGVNITNPLNDLYKYSEKFNIIKSLQRSLEHLVELKNFYKLIPETKTNFVYSLEIPKTHLDVAAIDGRITQIGTKIRYPNIIKFGTSQHVANALIVANRNNPLFRSAINIKNSPQILNICQKNFRCSYYSRILEPPNVKNKEGSSILWGINQAFKKNRSLEIVSHEGDYGKEPMIIVFGYKPVEVLNKIKIILYKLGSY